MRSIAIIFCLVLVLISFSQVQATIIHVPGDSATIQGGIDGAVNGDTILVAPGTYVENINFGGRNIVLGSLFLTTGDTSYISGTIIDGNSSGTVITFTSGEDTTTQVVGFTIRNGSGINGGGIFCYDSSSPAIRNNVFLDNYSEQGGGIHCWLNSSPMIEFNRFIQNMASMDGGGILLWEGCSPIIRGNTFRENIALYGGAIYCNQSSPAVDSNVMVNNSAESGGGMAFLNLSGGTVSDNTLEANIGSIDGGGIFCHLSSSPTIRNNLFLDNYSNQGGGIQCLSNSSPLIEYNLFDLNHGGMDGGGILLWEGCSATIQGNEFRQNTAPYGGAIYCHSSSPSIAGNLILDNSAWIGGGGIASFTGSGPTIHGNLVASNTAQHGGGLYCFWYSNPMLVNNTFDSNEAYFRTGGGIYVKSSCHISLTNDIISNSSAGYGVYCIDASSAQISYCDVWNNADGNYVGCSPGEACISADPIFCDSDNTNYHLWISSPCLGTGQDGTDIGAFGEGCSMVGDCNGDGSVDPGDVVSLINYLFRNGSAPQPLQAGDVNCDGTVDPGDVVYLINYLFRDGPPPCEP